MINIRPIPIYQDNYVWIIQSGDTYWVVDPGDGEPVIAFFDAMQQSPSGILITHRHWDHVTGVAPLVKRFQVPVFGPDSPDVPCVSHPLGEGDVLKLGSVQVEVLALPGHTQDHIGFYLPQEHRLFCGDTLFSSGCGRLFDGSMEQLFHSLQRLKALPVDTQVYCTHEYTLANIEFALAVEPDNAELKSKQAACKALRAKGEPTLPTTIGSELATNPFLRTACASVQKTLAEHGKAPPADELFTFRTLREWKNRY